MLAFGVGDTGNHSLPFRIMIRGRSWTHQNPYCCYICSKPEPLEPELQKVVHAPDKKDCWKRGTPKLRSQFPTAFAIRGALLSTHQFLTMILSGRLYAADSNVAKKSSSGKA